MARMAVWALLLAVAVRAQPRVGEVSEGLVGKAAPRVVLDLVGSGRLDLGALKGKVVLLAFWATWCEPCLRDIPRLIEAQREYKDRGLVVAGVSTEPAAVVKGYLVENGFVDFATASDPAQTVSKAYGVDLVPRLFVIDQKGVVVKMIRGLPSEGAIKRAVESLTAQ